jgi:hypothetical protein
MIVASRKGAALGVHAIDQAFHQEQQELYKSGRAFIPSEPVVYTKNEMDTRLLNGSLGRMVSTWQRGLMVDFDGNTPPQATPYPESGLHTNHP